MNPSIWPIRFQFNGNALPRLVGCVFVSGALLLSSCTPTALPTPTPTAILIASPSSSPTIRPIVLNPTQTVSGLAIVTEPPTQTSDVGVTFTAVALPSPLIEVPTPDLSIAILGVHLVRKGENVLCIARGYGVRHDWIERVNGLVEPYTIRDGQSLSIPAVQWYDISPGPYCPTQFPSPYPGLGPIQATIEPTPLIEPTTTATPCVVRGTEGC